MALIPSLSSLDISRDSNLKYRATHKVREPTKVGSSSHAYRRVHVEDFTNKYHTINILTGPLKILSRYCVLTTIAATMSTFTLLCHCIPDANSDRDINYYVGGQINVLGVFYEDQTKWEKLKDLRRMVIFSLVYIGIGKKSKFGKKKPENLTPREWTNGVREDLRRQVRCHRRTTDDPRKELTASTLQGTVPTAVPSSETEVQPTCYPRVSMYCHATTRCHSHIISAPLTALES
ncbi:hypothetical protein Syun_009363 [Stephania yunnanensis]|uniref:Uncharacterized protein n=1 Tax=Stephania yunnanensis TaxID=152371 RepID=A0AAP0KG84_9MAGN